MQYLSNCPLPPDFNIFWRQANQQGWKPRLATVAKVLLFPADTDHARAAGQQHRHRLVVGPVHARQSSLDPRLTASDSRTTSRTQTGKQWVQSIGGTYSLFEMAHQAFTSVSDPHDRLEVAQRAARGALQRDVRPAQLLRRPGAGRGHHPPGRRAVEGDHCGSKFPFEMLVVDNTTNPLADVEAHLVPTNPV